MIFAIQCRCTYTGCTFPGVRKRTRTAYVNDEQNFATLCNDHHEELDEHYKELWDMVHADNAASVMEATARYYYPRS